PLRAEVDQIAGPAVDRFLATLPVVTVPPVVDELGQEIRIRAGCPRAPVGNGDGRPPAPQTLVEIDQRPLGDIDLERLGRVVTHLAHVERRSADSGGPSPAASMQEDHGANFSWDIQSEYQEEAATMADTFVTTERVEITDEIIRRSAGNYANVVSWLRHD